MSNFGAGKISALKVVREKIHKSRQNKVAYYGDLMDVCCIQMKCQNVGTPCSVVGHLTFV